MPAHPSPEQLLELGYELFLEHAAEHLPAEDIVDITLEFEERGAVESSPPSAEWSAELKDRPSHDWIEIWVGLLDHQDEFSTLYAKILMPCSGDSAQAHIHWKPNL